MTKIYIIENGQKPTEKELAAVKAAKEHEITFDDNSPESSPALVKAFKSAVVQRNRKNIENNRSIG